MMRTESEIQNSSMDVRAAEESFATTVCRAHDHGARMQRGLYRISFDKNRCIALARVDKNIIITERLGSNVNERQALPRPTRWATKEITSH